jgi:predicted phage terminase large subunit-like protein
VLSTEDAIFKSDKLNRYTTLNDEGVNMCYIDTADEGKDHYAALIGRLTGQNFYVYDAIYNLHNLNINEPILKERVEKHNIDRVYCESNSFGMYFIRNIREQNPRTPVIAHNQRANKMGRILAQSGYILEFFYWPENPNEELQRFLTQMCALTPDKKDNDDAADCASGMAERIRRDFKL